MSHYKIRTAGKALIVENNKILLIKHHRDGIYYTLPGGGQKHNEELKDALVRECLEELGAKVSVLDTVFVFEYMADRHPQDDDNVGFHQLDIVFACQMLDMHHLENPSEIDTTQIGCEWIALDVLKDIVMYPLALREKICEYYGDCKGRVYLGEIS